MFSCFLNCINGAKSRKVSQWTIFSLAHERTLADQMREDELLADILNYVTRRSNIVDKMDEERLRWVLLTKSVVYKKSSFRVENKIIKLSLIATKLELKNCQANFQINGVR